MEIVFTKLSTQEHSVRIRRRDGSREEAVLDSRSFLRHDLAHLALETEVPIQRGYWGSVAAGCSLAGMDIRGPDIVIAESLAGAVQTLMRIEAKPDKYFSVLASIRPQLITTEIASAIHERGRKLQGHWKATPFGAEMVLSWQEGLAEIQQTQQ